ncbi:MAG TPA: histidine kinase dimerization/phospho-acceptor domain-containing protein, partial [Candidatus Limnocylindrales bacterium]|nr:histidine kinase dimerization/phospho-acceptor domain-containing protein [Candidatus Limnocylindrales bacterium]
MGHRSRQRRLLFFTTGLLVLLLLGQTVVSSGRWLNQSFPGFFIYQNLTVGPYFLPGWGGAAAGLKSLDRIISFDGRTLNDRGELYSHVRGLPADSEVRYQIIRDNQQREIVIPAKVFAPRDWLLSFGIYVMIGLAFLVIGGMPYFYRAASPVALPLCFMVMAVFIWFQTTFDFMTDNWLPKEIRIFALCLTPSAAIHLALLLRQNYPSASPHRLVVPSLYALGVIIAVFNSVSYFGPVEIWQQFFRMAYSYVFIGALAFLIVIASALRDTKSDLERSRLRVIFVGALAGFFIPALTAVLTSWLQLPIPYNIALVPTVFFPISVAYALLKYSLFDLGNVLKLALSRIALLAALVGIYAVVAIAVAPWAGENARDPLILLFFSLLVVMLFNPLLRGLEGVVDRYIYRLEYDPAEVQTQVSMFLRTLDSAPALATGFIERIVPPLSINGAALFYRARSGTQWLTVSTDPQEGSGAACGVDDAVLSRLWDRADFRALCRAEVLLDPRYGERRAEVLQLFERLRGELLLPLVYEHEVRGMLCFGAKRSGLEYSTEDFRLLGTLAEQLALSLENGRLYEESVAARQKAEASNQKLIEMDRVKKNFVANICHEIRTPVSTIIGFAEVLRDPSYHGDVRAILDRLVNNGQELSGLMDSLMNYSRMEADVSPARFEPVKLKEVLAGLTIMTQRLIRSRPIEFGVHIESAIDTIESDGQKLQQILVQLLTNALKFTEKGRIDLSIRGRRAREGEFLEIAVADTG